MRIKILVFLSVICLLLASCGDKQEKPPEQVVESSVPAPVVQGDYTATDYPSGVTEERVGDILTSLSTFMEQLTQPEFSTADMLPYAYKNAIVHITITGETKEAVILTADSLKTEDGAPDPLYAARQSAIYATGSGHTINNLSIADSKSSGEMDFSKFTGKKSGEIVTLKDTDAQKIVRYCAGILDENSNGGLYILSDKVIAFSMCERYSEDSLLGTVAFFEKDGDSYKLRTVIDFNC